MKNCLIMGFGRSGTSLMGGILHEAGYYMGEDLYPPRDTNPKGFFENALINGINERILKKYDFTSLNRENPLKDSKWSPFNPDDGHRWLTYIEKDTEVNFSDEPIDDDIKNVLSHKPYAYKDPRFNYTLNVWNKYLENDVLFLCIFREPWITIQSTVTECNTAEYLLEFSIDAELAEQLWRNSYLHLLKQRERIGADRFIFIHYKQLLDASVLPYLSGKLEVNLNGGFASADLNRIKGDQSISEETEDLYSKLSEIALVK